MYTEGAYRHGYQQGAGACSVHILTMLEQGKSIGEVRRSLAEWDRKLGEWREEFDEQGSMVTPPDPA